MSSRYLLRRVAQLGGGLVTIVLLTFLLLYIAPGDPAQTLAGESGNLEFYLAMREHLGLDLPLHQQFARYAGNLLRGDLGNSVVHGQPVIEVIGERLGPTLLLMGTALVLSVATGILLGVAGCWRPGGVLDTGLNLFVIVAYAIPSFYIAQVGVLVLGFHLDLFPLFGMRSGRVQLTGIAAVADVARHMMLPTLVLMTSEVALIARLTRAGLLEQLQQDYVVTARAKGVAGMDLLSRHALPNALLPVVTIIGGRVGFLFSGAVIIETVFAWPGIGTLLLEAVQARDNPVILGVVLLVATSVVIANIVTDLSYAALDPRIRFA
jgi:peptide/nickel transport system permease protein